MHTDINSVILEGRIAAEPELKLFDSGTRLIRYLVTTRVEEPRRRVDIVPVTLWDPTDRQWDDPGERGERIQVSGSIQRRFWESPDGRRSRLEVVAETIIIEVAEQVSA